MTYRAITYKSKAATVLLTLALGAFGAHRFYLGNTVLGVMYLLLSCVTLVAFPPALLGAQSETKHASRIRNDLYASSRYAHRVDIDRHNEDRALRGQLKEFWE